MATPTNVTDRITHLRERNGASPAVPGSPTPPRQESVGTRSHERRPASDFFMIFVYSLLAVTLASQLLLILWLDVVR